MINPGSPGQAYKKAPRIPRADILWDVAWKGSAPGSYVGFSQNSSWVLHGKYTKLNNTVTGAKILNDLHQWRSDKTAKTGFVGFDITQLGDYQSILGGDGCRERWISGKTGAIQLQYDGKACDAFLREW